MFVLTAKFWNLFAKVMCGLCVFCILIGAAFGLYRWDFLKHAVASKATIIDLIERRTPEVGTVYAPVYVFTDQRGDSIKILSSSASFPPPGQIGDTIDILYDPENPKHSIQKTFFDIWGMSAICGGLGVFYLIIFGAVAFFTGRRLRKTSEQCDDPNRLSDGAQERVPPLLR